MKSSGKMTLNDFKEKPCGVKGTKKRDELEKGMTQAELAEKVGATKSYISKIENNVKEVCLSTLQKIVQLGLGGHLDLSIRI